MKLLLSTNKIFFHFIVPTVHICFSVSAEGIFVICFSIFSLFLSI